MEDWEGLYPPKRGACSLDPCRLSYRKAHVTSHHYILYLFRVVKTTLSSSYNISGLVPVCLLLFQCF